MITSTKDSVEMVGEEAPGPGSHRNHNEQTQPDIVFNKLVSCATMIDPAETSYRKKASEVSAMASCFALVHGKLRQHGGGVWPRKGEQRWEEVRAECKSQGMFHDPLLPT